MSEDTKNALIEMGFSEEMAKDAIYSCKTTDMASLLEYIEKKQTDEINECKGDKNNHDSDFDNISILKCEQCGLIFCKEKASKHAEISGHREFKEATDEEKINRIKEMKQRIEDKRKQEEIEVEKSRRLNGKKIGSLRSEMRDLELKRAAEERVRERKLDILHRQRVKDQIKADRENVKMRNQKILLNNQTEKTQVPTLTLSSNDCKIMVRLPDGECIFKTFKRTDKLQKVLDWVEDSYVYAPLDKPITLKQGYPLKIFNAEDLQKSLDNLAIGNSHVFMIN